MMNETNPSNPTSQKQGKQQRAPGTSTETGEVETSAKQLAADAAEAGRDALSAAKEKATEAASRTASAARDEAVARAEGAKDALADEGTRLARSLRSAADSESGSFQARLLDAVAGGVSDASEGLRSRSLGSIWSDVEDMARRNPGAFVAGAALAGFALARFARASGERHEPTRALPTASPSPSGPSHSGGVSHADAGRSPSSSPVSGSSAGPAPRNPEGPGAIP